MSRMLWLVIIFNTILLGCINKNYENISYNYNYPYEFYKNTKKQLKKKYFSETTRKLKFLYEEYPFSSNYQQIQLDLIYSYYKNADFLFSKNLIRIFMKRYPNHVNIDYLFYMRGLSNSCINGSKVQKKLKMNVLDRNVIYIKKAFSDFLIIINNYKGSEYLLDAKKQLMRLKNILAKYDLRIAKFYNKKNFYIAVVVRVNNMLKKYPNEKETLLALYLMENAYRKLLLFNEADKISKIIQFNN